MSAEQLLRLLADMTFTVIFVALLIRAIRDPRPAAIDATIFFGVIAFVTNVAFFADVFGLELPEVVSRTRGALAMVLPYLLLRLLDDFAGVPTRIRWLAFAGLAASVISLYLVPTPYPPLYSLALVAYFVVLQSYNTWRFMQAVHTTAGVTQQRMRAAAAGSGFLALALVIAGLGIAIPRGAVLWQSITPFISLGSGLSYFLAFAPPLAIRRYWQAPALRSFLSTIVRLPAETPLPEAATIIEDAVAHAVGAPQSVIALWDDEQEELRTPRELGERPLEADRETTAAYRAFREQRALAVEDTAVADPQNAEIYEHFGAVALLAAPITTGDRRFGVLTAFAERASIFAEDDLALLALLAEDLAGFLLRRELVLAMEALQAREEAMLLKDEFLSAAAHDLRTPLTVLLAQGQLLQRHLRAREAPPEDMTGIARLLDEAQRMRRLTDDVLDASRLEAAGFIGELAPVELAALARAVAGTTALVGHTVTVEGAPTTALVDGPRIRQVMQNLVDNAIKFSPEGGEVVVRVEDQAPGVEITVSDTGIGIPAQDLPHLFGRFYRGSRVGEQGFAGMGIGLFLCKRIVEEHGGRIWAESRPGRGSRFHVALPQRALQAQALPDQVAAEQATSGQASPGPASPGPGIAETSAAGTST